MKICPTNKDGVLFKKIKDLTFSCIDPYSRLAWWALVRNVRKTSKKHEATWNKGISQDAWFLHCCDWNEGGSAYLRLAFSLSSNPCLALDRY
jgi:hypothetical protein